MLTTFLLAEVLHANSNVLLKMEDVIKSCTAEADRKALSNQLC